MYQIENKVTRVHDVSLVHNVFHEYIVQVQAVCKNLLRCMSRWRQSSTKIENKLVMKFKGFMRSSSSKSS